MAPNAYQYVCFPRGYPQCAADVINGSPSLQDDDGLGGRGQVDLLGLGIGEGRGLVRVQHGGDVQRGRVILAILQSDQKGEL